MSFTKSSRKPTEKAFSDSASVSFDLLSNLTYMAAVSTGGPSRDLVLERTIEQGYKTSTYFRQVYLLAKRLGFEYTRAYQMVARKTGIENVKSLLLRFAGAISSGVSESDFLAQEARVEREQYINGYHRSLETLTKWGDAYAALLVSVSLVVVVAMISTMLSEIGSSFVIMLTITMFMITGFGAYIILRVAPVEVRTYQSRRGPPERRWAVRLFMMVTIPGAVFGALLGALFGFELFIVTLGLALLPPGAMAWVDNGKVNKVDQEVAQFIRSLGNVSAALGATVAVSLTKIDRRSLNALEPHIQKLQRRLNSHIHPDKCWEAFRDEAGSELLSRTTRMFVDGVGLGGAPDKVGHISADYAMDSALMRARRNVSAAPFAFLVIPLHFAMTALMIFIFEIMKAFNTRIEIALEELQAQSGGSGLGLLPSLPVFQPQDMTLLGYLTLGALISMTVANALTPKFAMGGHKLLIAFFGAITCLMTGLNMLIIPPIAAKILLSGA